VFVVKLVIYGGTIGYDVTARSTCWGMGHWSSPSAM